MQNALKALVALPLLDASGLAAATEDTIASNDKAVLSTDSADTLKQSLQYMRAAALDAKPGTPPQRVDKVADSLEMNDFRHGQAGQSG